jgi:F0F1-type ATP synthase delta subunit
MGKIKFKKQIMNILIESFQNNDNEKMKNLLRVIKENDKLREMYLVYEDIEKK